MKPGIAIVALALGACSSSAPVAGGSPMSGAPAYTLVCHSASTATSRAFHCIRTDTRTGDVVRVAVDKLPVSKGPVGVSTGSAGRYATTCVAASSDTQSDFYCVRLSTDSGEMLLLDMTKLSVVP